MKRIFNDRKNLYFVLAIVMVCIFTLTIVYAALNTVLKITGNAEVVASSWDIYLDNIHLVGGSATTGKPTITNKTTASFTTTLSKPGDYYMFTIDVVNNGSIDAMIDGVTKTPTLSETQAKYLNYIVEYQSGESINTKQLVQANSFVRLKVKVEYRKDLVVSDLPSTKETLNLSFKVNYTQADDIGTTNIFNSGKLVKVVSGDYNTVGSEICIGDECFFVVSSDDTTVTMLSKYNLYVGGDFQNNVWTEYGSLETGVQNSSMLGWVYGQSIRKGVTSYSKTNYWYDGSQLKDNYGTSYPSYVYDNNSSLYSYIENYRIYLESQGVTIQDARLINMLELETLGCSKTDYSCSNALSWVKNTSYWSGEAFNSQNMWCVGSGGAFGRDIFSNVEELGVRPIIVISKEYF